MKTAAGIFISPKDAERALERLQAAGFSTENVVLLTPGLSQEKIDAVPTEDAEQPGMGKAIGGVVGGAVGLATGAAVSNLFLPGVGPVVAVGLSAGGLGIGGALAGAAGGGALENLLARGLPKDELFLYEDALRQGRAVIIALGENDDQLDQSRQIMGASGAESIDAARDKWWIGLRDAEAAQYDAPEAFERDEQIYRRGFEAALEPKFRGKTFAEAADALRECFPNLYDQVPFRRGYDRGQGYSSSFTKGREEANNP